MKHLTCFRLMATGLVLTLALTLVTAHADYPSGLVSQRPLAYFGLNESTAPTTDVAPNSGSLGAAANGGYQAYVNHPVPPGALAVGGGGAMETFGGGLMSVANNAAMNPNGAFTAEFWVRPASALAGTDLTCPLASLGFSGSERNGWLFYQAADGWQFRVGDSTGYKGNITGGTVTPATWQHVVGVYTGSKILLYINGVEAKSTDVPSFAANLTLPLTLGCRSDLSYNWSGQLDEVAVYAGALGADKILAHYSNGTNAAPATAYREVVLADSPIAYYELNDAKTALISPNLGTAGARLNAEYQVGVTTGAVGPRPATYGGFPAGNPAAQLATTGGAIVVPPLGTSLNEITITAWIKRNGAQSDFTGLVFARGPGTPATGLDFTQGNQIGYHWNDGAYDFRSGLVPPDNQWAFVAMVVEPTRAVFYLHDGTQWISATNTAGHAAVTLTAPFVIANDGAARRYSGAIDEVAIFDRALSRDEVVSQYMTAQGNIPITITSVTQEPPGQLYTGESFQLIVEANGTLPITYEWRQGPTPVPNGSGPVYSVASATPANSGLYTVLLNNGINQPTGGPLNVQVSGLRKPFITTAPVSTTRYAGGTATFLVEAGGSPTLLYQWYKSPSTKLDGEAADTLTLTNVTAADNASYYVRISNGAGDTTSDPVSLTVIVPTPGSYPSIVLSHGPIAYWRLDEATGVLTAYDFAGGNNGNCVELIRELPGAIKDDPDMASGFNMNIGSYVATRTNLLGHLKQFTVSGWIKRYSEGYSTRGGYFGQNNLLEFGDADNGKNIEAWVDANGGNIVVPYAFPFEEWGNLTLVGDGTKALLYTNGVEAGRIEGVVSDYGSSDFTFNIGGGGIFNDTGDYFGGDVDEVAVYDRALTADEAIELYLGGKYGASTPVTIVQQPASTTNLVGTEVRLQVIAVGSPPITYQWKRGPTVLDGQTASTLELSAAAFTDAGSYTVTARNGQGPKDSNPAELTVIPEPRYVNLPQSQVLHLKFEDDYTDSSGRGNNGTKAGNPLFVPGKIGAKGVEVSTDVAKSAYNYLQLGTPADLTFGPGVSFSVAFWVRFSGAPGDLPFLGNAVNSYGNPGTTLAPSYWEGGWSYFLNDGQGHNAGLYGPPNTLNSDAWQHLVFVFDRAGKATTYLDGAIVDQRGIASLTGTLSPAGQSLNIGQDPTGSYPETASYQIDDMGIWLRPLAQWEAQSIYIVGSKYGRSFDTEGPAAITIAYKVTPQGLELSWPIGTLESSTDLTTGWLPVPGASAPKYVAPMPTTPGPKYYRVR